MVWTKRNTRDLILSLEPSWHPFFLSSSALVHSILFELYEEPHLCPTFDDVFRVFKVVPVDGFEILVCSQDPYPNESACGIAFSIATGQHISPSLKNIFSEIRDDLSIDNFSSAGDLLPWTSRCLLLNTSLSTVRGLPGAHRSLWKVFSETLMKYISDKNPFFVFMAWGKHAHGLLPYLSSRHAVLKTSHPSPLGFGKTGEGFVSFKGSRCFSAANEILVEHGLQPFSWRLSA